MRLLLSCAASAGPHCPCRCVWLLHQMPPAGSGPIRSHAAPPTHHHQPPPVGTLMADLLRGTAAFADFSRVCGWVGGGGGWGWGWGGCQRDGSSCSPCACLLLICHELARTCTHSRGADARLPARHVRPHQALRVSMVEVSPVLRALQWQALRCPGPPPAADAEAAPAAGGGAAEAARGAAQAAATQQQPGSSIGSSSAAASAPDPGPAPAAIAGVSGWGGAAVSWHRSLDEVQPDGPALYIAHEFVDALPVHQFQRTGGWSGPDGLLGPSGASVAGWTPHRSAPGSLRPR